MERILDGAEDEFAARGFAGARLREIARSAGVQPALIHHYFADKQGLYAAVVRRAVDQMSTASWGVLSTKSDLEGIVRGFIDVMVDFSAAHRKLLSIMRSEILSGASDLVSVVRERSQPILDAIVDITLRLQEAEQVRVDIDPRDIVRAGLSLVLYPVVDAPVLEALLPEGLEGSESEQLARRKKVVSDLLLAAIRKPAK